MTTKTLEDLCLPRVVPVKTLKELQKKMDEAEAALFQYEDHHPEYKSICDTYRNAVTAFNNELYGTEYNQGLSISRPPTTQGLE